MATGYQAPLDDMRFVLTEIVDLEGLAALDGFDAVSSDLLDQVLGEAGKFATNVVAPLNQTGDREGAQLVNGVVRMPEGFADCYRQFVEAGWLSLGASPEYGGQGLPLTLSMALNEIWQSANMALTDGWMLTLGAADLLEAHGSEAQKATYLPKLVTGEWSGTMNLTEPGAGSDLAAVRTRAERDGDTYRITGGKIFITHGDQDMSENVIHLVLARLPDAPPGVRGISLFVVPKRLVGEDGSLGQHNDLGVVSLEHKLGHMASPTCVMSYGDNGGAVGTLIGEENRGIEYMFTMMNNARLNVAIQGVAIAERAYQAALEWAKERVQGRELGSKSPDSVPIIRHPDVRRMLMEMKSQIEAMRTLCYSVAEALDLSRCHPDQDGRARAQAYLELLTPVAKAWSTDQGFEMASVGVQIHGGMGYIEETGAAQHLRDARILAIYEGTNGIQALDLVRRKLRQDGGQAIANLIEDMHETLSDLGKADNEALAAIAIALAPAVDSLERTTEWIREIFDRDPVAAASGATPYCSMLGFIAGGWLLAKGALKAAERLKKGADNKPFLQAKITTARFFAESYLANAAAQSSAIMSAHNTVMALEEAEF